MGQESNSDNKIRKVFEPPTHKPHFNFFWPQFFLSLPILAIPVLALWGVFGETTDKIQSTQSPIEVTIEYPSKLRLKQRLPLSVVIKNISDENLEGLQVIFDKSYLDQFSDISATPTFDSTYAVELGTLPPAGVAGVHLEFQGQKYGQHKGEIKIQSKTSPLQTQQVESFVFP